MVRTLRSTLVLVLLLGSASPVAAQNVLSLLGDLFRGAQALNVSRVVACAGEAEAGGGRCPVRGTGAELLVSITDTTSAVNLELGLGLTVLNGFAVPSPTLDFRGSARELPTISVYASPLQPLPGLSGALAPHPYGGVSIGILELWNARGYDPDGRQFAIEAQSLQTGLVGGLWWDVPALSVNLFVEGGWKARRFSSLSYAHGGATTVPPGWPRELDLSGWAMLVGFGMGVRN